MCCNGGMRDGSGALEGETGMSDVHSINHTAICVHDLPQAIRFYCDVLGATPHQRTNFSTEDAMAGVAVFESVILED